VILRTNDVSAHLQIPSQTSVLTIRVRPCVVPRSSRLIFRNLPNTVQLPTFKAHLEQPSQLSDTTLTDVKLVSKRRFAFVGYKTEDEARQAKEWFDGTFLGSGKIKVDFVDDEVSPAMIVYC
jgi:multiple RNA-binding domain-containing protein 1